MGSASCYCPSHFGGTSWNRVQPLISSLMRLLPLKNMRWKLLRSPMRWNLLLSPISSTRGIELMLIINTGDKVNRWLGCKWYPAGDDAPFLYCSLLGVLCNHRGIVASLDTFHSQSGRVYRYIRSAMRNSGNVAKSRRVILKLVSNCSQTAQTRQSSGALPPHPPTY
jgi:hypothetical protein